MMPTDNSLGWPNNGEIDIWETIDTEDRAYGTVHTNWTYNLKKGGNSRYMEGLDYDYWHIFAVEWDPTSITWYVDGKKMWSYLKSTKQSELEDGQWPFDAPFYLILNQSVGSGAWAKPADIETIHLYFKAAGLEYGDKIAINARSSANWIKTFMAAISGGYVAVELFNGYTPKDTQALVHHSDSRILFTV